MARIFRFTAARRSALRKAQAKSARKRKGLKSKDTFGPYIRSGIRAVANLPTMGKASGISNFIEGKQNNRPSKWQSFYKDRSGKRRKRR
jgi:hypothetical protein